MASDSEKTLPIPQLFGSADRWYARNRAFYESRKNLHKYFELKPTPEELKRFSAENPELGDQLERCRLEKEYTKYGTVIGTTACVLQAMRWTKTKPYIVVTGVFGLFASIYGSRNIGGWVNGTYKFDEVALNRTYLSWVESSRRS